MDNKDIESQIKELQDSVESQKRVTKNTLKFAFIICVVSFFLVTLNFSILLTLSGGVAGSDKKINGMQHRLEKLEKSIKS